MKKFSSQERGFTLVENLMAILIGVIGLSAIISGVVMYGKVNKSIEVLDSTENNINQIAESIRANIGSFQINNQFSGANIDVLLDPKKLPMAWDTDITASAEDCPSCLGRFGFVIQPFEAYRGLYLVTLRVTYASWGSTYKDYEFVVSAK